MIAKLPGTTPPDLVGHPEIYASLFNLNPGSLGWLADSTKHDLLIYIIGDMALGPSHLYEYI
jgi:hypothetical protein